MKSINELYIDGISVQEIARLYGVSIRTVYRAITPMRMKKLQEKTFEFIEDWNADMPKKKLQEKYGIKEVNCKATHLRKGGYYLKYRTGKED